MLVLFFKFLIGVAIAYILALMCFVLEFTIGIKRSIKKLYKG